MRTLSHLPPILVDLRLTAFGVEHAAVGAMVGTNTSTQNVGQPGETVWVLTKIRVITPLIGVITPVTPFRRPFIGFRSLFITF